MKKIIFVFSLFFPIFFFTQKNYKEDAEYLRKNCNQESLNKAIEIYSELQAIQMDNSFDTTLKNYYEFLESAKCSKFNIILVSAWEKDKLINENSFKNFFLNSKEHYNSFINGYTLQKPFRFANKNNLDQGIDPPLQTKMLKYVESVSKEDLQKVISTNIETLRGQELIDFISVIESNFNLKNFKEKLIEKSFSSKYPYDLNFLLNHLIKLKIDKATLENIVSTKKDVWDKGNWSEKFWSLIKQENLNIPEESFYQINSDNKKKYNIKSFLKAQEDNNFIGKNPLVMINHNIFEYKENNLIESLEKIDIKDIQVMPKQNSVKLYGARGVDGVLMILTN